MMVFMLRRFIAVMLMLSSVAVMATNGYVAHGYGTQSKSMGGAGVALPLDTLAAATNPAAMVHLGDRLDVGVAVFNPNRGFTADDNAMTPPFASIAPGELDSRKKLFLIPHFGRNWMLDEHSSVGVSVGGNGGMNTDYEAAVFGNFGPASSPTGVDFTQLFIGVTYARKLTPRHSIGVTPIFIAQSFKAEGLEPFAGASIHPGEVTNKGHDYSYGAALRIGWLGRITDDFNLGASYQTRGYMSRFDQYRGLFAEEGDFDVPPSVTVGLAWEVNPALTLALDYQRIFFSDIKALANPNGIPITPGSLGGDDGLGFGWRDMPVVKFGAQWKYDDDLTLRAGFSHARQVIPESQALFNILAPATVTDHLTFGFSRDFGSDRAMHASFTHAFEKTVRGTNPNTGPQTGSITMSQNELEVSWSWQF